MRVYLLVMVIAAAVTYLMVPAVRRLALVTGALTQVRERDIHRTPIARLGGIAMFLGLAVSFTIAAQIPYLGHEFAASSSAWAILLGAGIICLVGVIDDVWELDWYAKLAGMILAAGIMAWRGVQFVSVPVGGLTVGSPRLTLFLTIIVIVTVANAINFIDGLDGLAAGVVGIASLAFFVYTYMLTREASPGDYSSVACVVIAALVGICAGMLPHNFHPASIFMGDSGALMLGLVFGAAGIVVTGQIDPAIIEAPRALPAYMPIILPIAVLIIPLADFIWAVVRRLARGQSPFTADAGHLHHRLLRAGNSHRGAVLVIYVWSAWFSFMAVGMAMFAPVPVIALGAVSFVGFLAFTALELRGPKTRAS
ncbi:MAG: MraY family glycosyltransferase [Flaviflexus sp.]|nr:MraY family glycosyltransferase [Flaviflexus sp.]